MRKSSVNHRKTFGSDQKSFGHRVAAFLRARHPQKPTVHAAAATGCTPAQVEKWLGGASAPSGAAFQRLIAAYGPAMLAAVFIDDAPEWVRAAERAERHARLEAEIEARRREIGDLIRAAEQRA